MIEKRIHYLSTVTRMSAWLYHQENQRRRGVCKLAVGCRRHGAKVAVKPSIHISIEAGPINNNDNRRKYRYIYAYVWGQGRRNILVACVIPNLLKCRTCVAIII